MTNFRRIETNANRSTGVCDVSTNDGVRTKPTGIDDYRLETIWIDRFAFVSIRRKFAVLILVSYGTRTGTVSLTRNWSGLLYIRSTYEYRYNKGTIVDVVARFTVL